VLALVDRFAHDPDGADPAAYLLLSQEGASSGAEILADVERRLRGSGAARSCLARASGGTVEYELEVDDSGITYQLGGTLGMPARACVDDVLAEIVNSTIVAPPVKAAVLKVSLR